MLAVNVHLFSWCFVRLFVVGCLYASFFPSHRVNMYFVPVNPFPNVLLESCDDGIFPLFVFKRGYNIYAIPVPVLNRQLIKLQWRLHIFNVVVVSVAIVVVDDVVVGMKPQEREDTGWMGCMRDGGSHEGCTISKHM